MASNGVCMLRGGTTIDAARMGGGRAQKLLSSTATTKYCSSEILSGSLTMLGGASDTSSLRVCVKVYRTSLEHFAVVYPDKVTAKPIGYVNLRNCAVECSSGGSGRVFHVVRKSCDGDVLTFRTESPCDVLRWAEALHDGSLKTPATSAAMTTIKDKCQIKVSLPIVFEEGDEE